MTDIRKAKPGDVFKDADGSLWEVTVFRPEPSVRLERVVLPTEKTGQDKPAREHIDACVSGLTLKDMALAVPSRFFNEDGSPKTDVLDRAAWCDHEDGTNKSVEAVKVERPQKSADRLEDLPRDDNKKPRPARGG